MSNRTKTPHPLRRPLAIAALAAGTVASLIGAAGPASAHDGHTINTTDRTAIATTSDDLTGKPGVIDPDVDESLVWELADVIDRGDHGSRLGGLTTGRGVAGLDTDCLVDFDDDLVLQYSIPNAAYDTFMNAPWYQACNTTHYYPAVAVKPMEYGHFHLGYEDPRIGPCAGDTTDWGRHTDPAPAVDDPAFIDWFLDPCASAIDPVTEPRSGIMPHLSGQRAQVFAYDGDGHLPFQLTKLQVVGGDVEVCHLPPGPWEAASPGGSPWQCQIVSEGYWNLSNHVDNAIEVRIEFLDPGVLVDNIGIDLLEG
jgi:hypothetical protein